MADKKDDAVRVKGHTRRKKAAKKEHPGTLKSPRAEGNSTRRITQGVEVVGGGDKRAYGEPRKGVTILERK